MLTARVSVTQHPVEVPRHAAVLPGRARVTLLRRVAAVRLAAYRDLEGDRAPPAPRLRHAAVTREGDVAAVAAVLNEV